LTSEGGIEGTEVGKIQIANSWAYVAVQKDAAETALRKITQDKLKGKKFKARKI